ncbi:MAG TPA: hypothetical protein VEI02_12845 [Planctomycetota bacterium]|nr:hypothetical protein [Planctomycetota bacterium]
MPLRRLALLLAPAAFVAAAAGCSQTSGRMGAGSSQTAAEVRQVVDRLQPTVRQAPGADRATLWQATKSYMEDLFPIGPNPPEHRGRGADEQVIVSSVFEFDEGSFPHRTQVWAKVGADPGTRNARLSVTALLIEPTPLFQDARSGVPLAYEWRVQGSNTRIEQAVADGILQRYLALAEGRPIPDLGFQPIRAIPGLRQKSDSRPAEPGAPRPIGD